MTTYLYLNGIRTSALLQNNIVITNAKPTDLFYKAQYINVGGVLMDKARFSKVVYRSEPTTGQDGFTNTTPVKNATPQKNTGNLTNASLDMTMDTTDA